LLGWQESVLGLARDLVSLMLMRAERQGDTESKLWEKKEESENRMHALKLVYGVKRSHGT